MSGSPERSRSRWRHRTGRPARPSRWPMSGAVAWRSFRAMARARALRFRPAGTVVVVQGPRFSTRAESRWYGRMGWDIVGMTQYPEVILARELEMCYLNLSLVTDYDAGVEGAPEVAAVQAQEVMRVLAANIARVRDLLATLIPIIPSTPSCACQHSLDGARM